MGPSPQITASWIMMGVVCDRPAMETSANLVNVHWLAEHLDDPNLVIIDTRFSLAQPDSGRAQYQDGHILDAYYLNLNQDLSQSVQTHGGRHPLPDWDTFTTKLNQLGIHSASSLGPTRIVIYDDSRFAFAARLWWMLRYLGHENVSLFQTAAFRPGNPLVCHSVKQFHLSARAALILNLNLVGS